MKVSKQFTCNLPIYAVMFLEYSDISDLTDEDIQNIKDWLHSIEELGYTDPYFAYNFDDTFFSGYPEFGLPCECVSCTVIQFE